jgi:GT2 family glycosyltransferase
VILTYERRELALRAVARALALPERPEIVVVDNGSRDGTAQALASVGERVRVLRSPRNLGAAGRNLGLAATERPFVAFSDDDVWWRPGALARAADLLAAHPHVGVVTARVQIEPDGRIDPTCRAMAESPLPRDPAGPPLVGFLAGACVARRSAFLAAGGYEARLGIGGEEELLALELLTAGWRIVYASDVVAHHEPSPLRDARVRRHLLRRNAALVAWLRRPLARAWAVTAAQLRDAGSAAARAGLLLSLLRRVPWLLGERRPLRGDVEAQLAIVEASLRGRGASEAARGGREPAGASTQPAQRPALVPRRHVELEPARAPREKEDGAAPSEPKI